MSDLVTEKPAIPLTLPQPGFWLAAGMTVSVLILQTLLTIPLSILDVIASALKMAPPHLSSEPLTVAIINLICFGMVIWLGLLIARTPLRRAFPFAGLKPSILGSILLTSTGSAILLSEIDNVTRWFLPMPEWFLRLMADLFLSEERPVALFFLLVVVAPVTEELLFRGVILRGLLRRFHPWVAIGMSSALFAIVHLNPWQLITAFAVGMVSGWFFLKTGSLWPCIAAHALNNLMAWLASVAPFELWEPINETTLRTVEFQPWWLDMTGAALLMAGLFLFRRSAPASPVKAELMQPAAPPVIVRT
jgi:membrane protease YdiL (CAAX protease family)